MSRLAAKVRCNYFPLPDAEANLIRSCLAFPDQETSALDPCAGEGRAMAAITAGSEATTYGIRVAGCARPARIRRSSFSEEISNRDQPKWGCCPSGLTNPKNAAD
jgi:hypothetical protein